MSICEVWKNQKVSNHSTNPMSQEKVLIVEDEENERTGLAELVSAWGYRPETARDGMEGLEKINSFGPSIVVTDMRMPRMGGLELLERIGTDTPNLAVIVVTAQGTKRCAWARTTTLQNPSTPAGFAASCRMRLHCWEREWSWKLHGASCATQVHWEAWWDHRSRCRKYFA